MSNSINFNEWNLITECAHLLNSDNKKAEANRKIIECLEYIKTHGTQYKEIWASILESAGFYPYLQKYKEELTIDDTQGLIKKEFFASKNLNGIYFHEEQKILVNKINRGNNMIISAPTSFGKSLLIEEIVANKKFRDIVIIQPTLALLDETRKKLSHYNDVYKIIVHTSQSPDQNKGNIYLFTAERVLEYQKFRNIDFFVLDEFYKLSKTRDDERADILNNALLYIFKKYNCQYMLLGPNIDGISNGFEIKYNAEFFKTEYSLVLNNQIDIYKEYPNKFGDRGTNKEFKEQTLFELLYNLRSQATLIFCSSPTRARKLGKSFLNYLKNKSDIIDQNNIPLIEWIDKNISPDWTLKDMLKQSIGIHDGTLPKHITSSIIKYFNERKINFLFCTTTIIEGVNTSAQNIIYFDKTKGNRKPIDYFDYCNIKGRAGRMMIHLIGNIYNFNEPPQVKKTVVDIPFFEQKDISDEILINLDETEMKYPEKEQNQYILKLRPDIKELFRKNGVLVKGQEAILNELLNENNYELICWSGYPKYEQLEFVLGLAWKNLIRPGEAAHPMTKGKLVKLTFDYGKGKSINQMIRDNYKYYFERDCQNKDTDINEKKEILDKVIQEIFQTTRHWFEYKIPKWLNVINVLQEYACTQLGRAPGNYSFYANIIEHNLVPENATILLEYNIPSNTVKKILKEIPKELCDEKLIDYIIDHKISDRVSKYEKELLDSNLIHSKI